MAEMPLQKSPSGLLGAFDLKTLGHAPVGFGDIVQPSVETLDMYVPLELAEKPLVLANPDTYAADTWDVPNGEVWIVRALGYQTTLAAADLAKQGTVLFSINNGGQQCPLTNLSYGTVPANGLRAAGFICNEPLWVRSGWGLLVGVAMSAAPAVANNGTMSIVFQRIRE